MILDTLAFAMQIPLLGLALDFPPLDSAHAKRTKRKAVRASVLAAFFVL